MKIKMHRKPNQRIGIVEIYTDSTRILIDGGENLEGNDVILAKDAMENYQFSEINAVFLSHYHSDYVTVTRGLLENASFYAGELTASMLTAAMAYKAKTAVNFTEYYKDRTPITVGDIKVTPILTDLQKYNGYMLLIESGSKSILYAGDFRANARTRFQEILVDLPQSVDVLICEEGTISKFDINLITEFEVKARIAEKIKETKGPVFVIQDVTDFDRTMSVFQSTVENKRIYLQDLYMAQIARGAAEAMPNPMDFKNTYAYLPNVYKAEHIRFKMFTEQPRVGLSDIVTSDFVMNIRPNAKKYLKILMHSLSLKGGVVINTVPYYEQKNPDLKAFIEFMQLNGVSVLNITTSGHAGAKALRELVNTVKPKKIAPLIVENATVLYKQYPTTSIITADEIWC